MPLHDKLPRTALMGALAVLIATPLASATSIVSPQDPQAASSVMVPVTAAKQASEDRKESKKKAEKKAEKKKARSKAAKKAAKKKAAKRKGGKKKPNRPKPPTTTPQPPTTTPQPPTNQPSTPQPPANQYPLHTGIVATTFWVGEIFDPNAEDGSQMISTYDDNWFVNYGGCDGRVVAGDCVTERRFPENGYFPTSMTPQQNPFYLDLPYDDLNDPIGFKNRGTHLPWAHTPANKPYVNDPRVSLMKDRWVRLVRNGRTCYGQIEDAGPGEYHDATYVFGATDARPANARYGGAGMDVSPALNSCLDFSDLNGQSDKVDWQFVDDADVPDGPWKRIVTSTPRPAAR